MELASRILALISRRLAEGWYARYAFRPVLLESFVEKPRFNGICYKVANWLRISRKEGQDFTARRSRVSRHVGPTLVKQDVLNFLTGTNIRQ